MSDLDYQINLSRFELGLYPEGHPNRVNWLHELADLLRDRFDGRGARGDIDEAIALERSVLELRPKEYPGRVYSLGDLATCLYRRFSRFGGMSDLEEAIALQRNALELCPQGHPHRAYSLAALACSRYACFHQLGKLSDLEEAISLQRSTLELHPQGHPQRAHSLTSLACCLCSRFNQLGKLSDLEEAISLDRSGLQLRPQGSPDRAYSLGNLATCLSTRFGQLGRLSDLEEALALERSALGLCPQGHPYHAKFLCRLAVSLHSHFKQVGRLSYLEEAIYLERSALEIRLQGDPERLSSLLNLADCLYSRFKRLGRLSDLEEAITFDRSALELYPRGHPLRSYSLGYLASFLYSRFRQLGRLSDLEEAITFDRITLELRPQGHPDRSYSLGNLATGLHSRFRQLGRLSDLEEALALERSALELRLPGHVDRAGSLSNLASSLRNRFKKLGRLSDLEEAIALEHSALELRPQGHPNRAHSLANLANCLDSRFKQLGRLSDLKEAIVLERSALELCPQEDPDRAFVLDDLASFLYHRFNEFGSPSDLEEAISLARSALELFPQGHPYRALPLGNLACYLHARFKDSPVHHVSDLQETFNVYSQLSEVSQTVSLSDLECAKQWIQKAEECKHSTTVLAYQTSLRLSVHHLATVPSLPQNLALLKQLITTLAVDAFSACLRHDNPTNAIELLEQGRGVFWSQLIRLRSPLDDVVASGDTGKILADKFTQVVSLLRGMSDAPPDADSQHDRAWRLNVQLQNVTADIRKLPGLSRFLQPPLFSDLQVAAAGGPVIIVNSSQYGCDAVVLLSDKDPLHVPLTITKADVSERSLELYSLIHRSRFRDVKKEIMVFLRGLWDAIVFPIVNVLQEFYPHRVGSRIWWCPTAEFSLLPLHAAGSFRKGQPMLSDLYISSYTPTLTALIRARQERPSDLFVERHRFLIVGQAQAPGQKPLASVNIELANISQRVGSVATLTCIQDDDATIAKVGEELSKNDFVHLACHGIPDEKHPFESGFLLCDGLLKVEDILRYDLQNAKFAYLSACHTTVGDKESPDEVIHLAAAMQFAGFRSVIGTMWAVDDAHTDEITSRFYENMVDESGRLDHGRAALALHKTMRRVRSSDVPFDQWILYIHIGA